MRRFFIGLLVVAAIVAGGSLIASVAFQAGLNTAITTVAADAPPGTVVTPVVPVPGWGWGWGAPGWNGGFSFFGFLGTILVIFLFIGLIRVLAFGGRGGWGGPGRRGGWGGPDGQHGDHPWKDRARSTFDDWHREAHGPDSGGDRPATAG